MKQRIGLVSAREPLLLAGVLLVAFNLRAAVVAVAPVLNSIRRDTGMSSAAAGALTSIPVFCFGAFSLPALRLARRLGIERMLLISMLLVAAGSLARIAVPTLALFAGTALIGAGIAAGNVLLPALVKRDFLRRAGAVTALYVTVMTLGATVASGTTVPLARGTGLGWRAVLALWGAPACLAVIWLALQRRHGPDLPTSVQMPAVKGLHRDLLAWQVTGYIGMQSFSFYAITSWLPSLFSDGGLSASHAGFLLSIASFAGIPGALVAPVVAVRRPTQFLPMAVVSGMWLAGVAGLLIDPIPWAPALMVLLGVAQGASLGLALTLVLLRSRDSRHAAALSTMAQGVGYMVAGLGPLVLGVLHAASGGWTLPLVALGLTVVLQCAVGIGACRNRHVGRGGLEPSDFDATPTALASRVGADA